MQSLRRLLISLAVVAAGLVGVGVLQAPEAQAQFPCSGSCGELDFFTRVLPLSQQQFFGGYIRVSGILEDDSGSCGVGPANCNSPVGTVEFYNQGTKLGSSATRYFDNMRSEWGVPSNGFPETFVRAVLPARSTDTPGALPGHHTLRVQYVPGTEFYFDSNSHPVDVIINPSYSTTTLTQTPVSTVTGQKTRLKVHVDGVYPGTDPELFAGFPHKPEGAVVVFQGGQNLDPPLLLDANGNAEGDYALDPTGSVNLLAHYIGDGDFEGSYSETLQHAFTKGNTSIGLSSPTSSSVVGLNYPVTAHVAAVSPASGVPTGSVTFEDTTTDTTLGTITLDAGGDATIQLGGILGSHSIVGTYNGSGAFNTKESAPLAHTVVKGDASNNMSQNKASTVFGEPFNVAAGLTPLAPATAIPTGTVTFGDADVPLGTATISGGQASLSVSSLTVGSHIVTADYSGDGAFNPKRATILHVVTKAVTTTALAATGTDPAPLGSPVTYTATISVESPGAATPTGTVQFFEGSVPLGRPVPVSGNAASITTVLGGGTHSVTAKYNGDQRLRSSTSDAIERTVACDQTVSGTMRSYTAPVGGLTCMVNATVRSTLSVPAGAALFVTGSQVNGVVKATNAAAFMVCGTTVNGAFTVQGTTGWFVLGGPPLGCGTNLIKGRTLLTNNHGGVLVADTTFRTTLTCTGNSPVPVNGGNNTIRRSTGQCATPGF